MCAHVVLRGCAQIAGPLCWAMSLNIQFIGQEGGSMACGNMVSGLTKHLMMLLLRPPHASMKQAKGITVDGDAAAQAQPCQPRFTCAK